MALKLSAIAFSLIVVAAPPLSAAQPETDVEAGAPAALKALRADGIKIVLDDFGTGYSSLAHLQRLEVDKVKIDSSFVQKVGELGDSSAIVQAVAHLGRTLGIAVTAEGVETDEQRQFLRSSGCTELQGYLIAPPLPAEEVDRAILPQWGMTAGSA